MHDDVICRQHRKHRKQRKSGKQDPETPWSRARLAQFTQIRQQVALGSEATGATCTVSFSSNQAQARYSCCLVG